MVKQQGNTSTYGEKTMTTMRWLFVAVVIGGSAGALFSVPGCANLPAGTVLADLNGDGKADVLAVDADRDGVPDKDANGNVLIVTGSKGYKTAEELDTIVPGVLGTAGALLGSTALGAILAGVGVAWKMGRFGRVFMNTVMTVQAARQALKNKNLTEALAVVDGALSRQTEATQKAVDKVKDKLGVLSVSDQPASAGG